MILKDLLATAAILSQNTFYRLTFPSVGEVIDGGTSAMEDGGVFGEASQKVDELGGGASNVTYKVAVWVFIIGLIAAAVALFFSNSGNRQEHKSNVAVKVVAAVLAFAAVGLIGLLATIGGGLF